MGNLMSTIKANDLTNTTGGIPTVKSQQLIPTAWVNFNGTGTVTIRDSEGVSSISDNATGQYSVVFSAAMSDANYAAVTAGMSATAGDGTATGTYTFNHTTTRCDITNLNNGGSFQDVGGLSIVVMGGQA